MKKNPSFYYICSVENLASILTQEILSRSAIRGDGIPHEDIHDPGVLDRRDKKIPNGKHLHDYVNLYFQPRNAMLYRLVHNVDRKQLVVLEISPDVLNGDGVFVSDRNAAAAAAKFYSASEYKKHLNFKVFERDYWTDSDDTKQKMMAEALIPDRVDARHITGVLMSSPNVKNQIEHIIGKIPPIVEPRMFFSPSYQRRLSEHVYLSKGDMFFSSMQTFTISVNTVGVMGKGLASRAKYQFPDAYVRYQDDCKSKKLQIGQPTLYKRAMRIEEELADDRSLLNPDNLNGARWFLFFPTKRHWREDSRMGDIEKSLQWLLDNYQKEDIDSIALPALGCGLGKLHWKDVGPLMCSYLEQMDIQSCIYLPMDMNEEEHQQYLSKEYLLR